MIQTVLCRSGLDTDSEADCKGNGMKMLLLFHFQMGSAGLFIFQDFTRVPAHHERVHKALLLLASEDPSS